MGAEVQNHQVEGRTIGSKGILQRTYQRNPKRCRKATRDEDQDKMFELVDSKVTGDYKESISIECWWLKLQNRKIVEDRR